MKKQPIYSFNCKKITFISDNEQEVIEKPSNLYTNERFEKPISKKLLTKNNFLKHQKFRKVLSLEELDFSNKTWIGYYLDICLKKRKSYVFFFLIKTFEK